MENLLHAYTNGGVNVSIYADGTKVRETVSAVPPVLPEQMDLKITNWCDAGCGWCHENSTTSGVHGDLRQTINVLQGLNPGTEIAIGGGDPLSHPDFEWFVRELRNMGIVPSVTVNGRHFERSLSVLDRLTSDGVLFGVGISFYKEMPKWDYPHKVIHMIAGVNSARQLLDEAETKVLVLGYKQFGRGEKVFEMQPDFIRAGINEWYRLLPLLARKHHLSFDNLGISQLKPRRLFQSQAEYDTRYMGEEGKFSMYVDAVEQTFALCSYAKERFQWKDASNKIAHMFPVIQTRR